MPRLFKDFRKYCSARAHAHFHHNQAEIRFDGVWANTHTLGHFLAAEPL